MRLGSGNVQIKGCVLDPANAILFCHHNPPHVPNRDDVLAYLAKLGVELGDDVSLTFDPDGNADTVLLFGNRETLLKFQALVGALAASSTKAEGS